MIFKRRSRQNLYYVFLKLETPKTDILTGGRSVSFSWWAGGKGFREALGLQDSGHLELSRRALGCRPSIEMDLQSSEV